MGRTFVGLAWLVGLALVAFVAMVVLTPDASPDLTTGRARAVASISLAVPSLARPFASSASLPWAEPAQPVSSARGDCAAPGFNDTAHVNAASLTTLAWAPFHRREIGWETYAPRIASEIGSPCAPNTPAFARALAGWQRAHQLPANGRMDIVTFAAMNALWERARPFARLSQTGVCPDAPPPTELEGARPNEGYGGKPVRLRPEALDAYRRLVAAARAASPLLAADHRLLTIFSGYRDPPDDAARCAREGNCGGASRANCSAHRTGLAMDLYLGAAPGETPDSAEDANRLYLSRTPTYAWLIAHAAAFGLVNYPFEPWHWEWAGAAS